MTVDDLRESLEKIPGHYLVVTERAIPNRKGETVTRPILNVEVEQIKWGTGHFRAFILHSGERL